MNETDQIKKRLSDLANKAYSRDICSFTNFLSLTDLDIYYQMEKELNYVPTKIFGGADYCERKIIRFGNLNTDFPILCIHIQPVLKKFSDKLTHRDFLGAVINLGIKRETIGDILVFDNEAYIFCLYSISNFIVDNLTRVKHTVIKCKVADELPDSVFNNAVTKEFNVASTRLDAVIGEIFNLSRSQGQEIIREKKVFVNGRIYENNSYQLKPNDNITVRGMGKFTFNDIIGNTKKGRFFISADIYR